MSKLIAVLVVFIGLSAVANAADSKDDKVCKHRSGYKTYVGRGSSLDKAKDAMREDCWNTHATVYEKKTKKPLDADLASTDFIDACINLNCE